MRALCLPLAVTLVATACAPRATPVPQPTGSDAGGDARTDAARPIDSAVDSARALVRALVERERLPGLAITVSGADEGGVWREGFGFADLEARTPADPRTRFRIGSVSKLLTATALMRLAQSGAIDLDAPIAEYMSGLPPHLQGLTLRQLGGHLGGVRHYRGSEFLTNESFQSLRQAIGIFADDSLVAAPGDRYEYTSYGYNLIGAVLEEVRNRPFHEVVLGQVLDPLGMDATGPDVKGVAIPRRAETYSITETGVTPAPEDDLSGRWPSGGYLSSTDDMARLGHAVLDPGLLSAASLEIMLTPQRLGSGEATSVGIGWRLSVDADGREYWHHGGSSIGGRAFLLVYPRERLVVAMASNAYAQWGERDALAVADIFLKAP